MPALNTAFQTPTHQHGMSGYDPSLASLSITPVTPARLQFEVSQLTEFAERPSSSSGYKTSADQPATPTYAPLWEIPAQSQFQFLQFYLSNEHPQSGSEHKTSADQQSMVALSPSHSVVEEQSQIEYPDLADHVLASHSSFYQRDLLALSPSQSIIPMESEYQDHHLKKLDDFPPFDGGHEVVESPAYEHHLSSFSPLQSAASISVESQYQDRQLNTFAEYPSFNSGHEIPIEQRDGNMSDALPRPVTPALSQEQVDAQPNEPMLSISSDSEYCPCGKGFKRAQERNRHVESHLPHSIYCPSPGCPWTGRRQWDLKKHWENKHSKTVQVPGKEKTEIYDPEEFVESILHGTSLDEVASSAYLIAKERLQELGKEAAGANVLGRKLGIPPPFIPLTLLDHLDHLDHYCV